MDFRKYIFSRGLPKTGQTIEYVAGDDGTYEAGWWVKKLNANNRTRFVVKTINGDVVVFDRSTGLCWAMDGNEAGCNNGAVITWPNAIIYANGLDFAGFTDWRLPNVFELNTLVNYTLTNPPLLEPPFSNTAVDGYWTATTYKAADTFAWRVKFTNGATYTIVKTDSMYMRCVRKGL